MQTFPYTGRILPLLALAFVLGTAPARAQATAGEVSGYISDSTGARLPGVTVTITFPEIAVTHTTVSNDQGFYLLPALPRGSAVLVAELDGFQRFERPNLPLALGDKVRVDIALTVGQVSETVSVVAATPVLATRADVAHRLDSTQVQQIAVDGRSYMQFMTLLPGVSSNGSSYEFGTSFRADGQQINGLRKNLSGLTVDGAENLDAGSNATQVNNVSLDAIEEIKVLTSQYSAEYGRSGGAQIQVLTKRGTRDFRGGGYYFLRNGALDAKNFATAAKDDIDFKNFGWTLSGPVAWRGFNEDRSKLFFFVGQEFKRLDTQTGQTKLNVAVPSLQERRGDFSQSPRIPTDPLTGQPFPGGIIPANRLSPTALDLVNRFPAPNTGAATATLLPTQQRDIRQDIFKIDWPVGPASSLSVRVLRDRVEQLEPYGSFGGTSGYAQVPTSHDRFSDSLVVNYNHPIGSKALHELTFSAVRNDQLLLQSGDLYQRGSIPVAELFAGNRGDRAPNITTLDGYSLGTGLLGSDYPTHIIGNYYTLKSNITWMVGNHALRFGGYLAQDRKSEELRTPDAGVYTFTNSRPNGTGIALANMLLGLASTYSEADRAPYGNLRFNQVELYVQEHWQAKRNLTIDAGVRWQYMPGPYERQDLIATFDPGGYDPALAPRVNTNGTLVPNTGSPVNGIVQAGQDGVPRSLYATDWNNLAPRVGVTWDPTSTGRTLLRGGFGVYYDRPVFNSSRDQAGSPPLVRSVRIDNTSVENPASGSVNASPPAGFEALATTIAMPTVYSYSVGVQRDLPWKVVADASYVGNQARHLLRVRELNYVTPESLRDPSANVNYNRPYQGYGRIVINETTANSDYDSLQVSVNRRPTAGLSAGLAYTLSRARGDADSEDSTSTGSLPQDPANPAGEYGFQDFDRRHVLAVNFVYELPFRRNRSDVAGQLLGGWQVSGVGKWNTGRRFNVTAGTTTIRGDQSQLRANLVEGQDPNAAPAGGRTVQHWFNTAAFVAPAANTFGTSPRNVLVGPSFHNWDLSLLKNIRAGLVKAQLRIEAFNVFNIENYKTIDANITSRTFGAVTAYELQRIVQVGMKVTF
jgi:hypothetical protein